MQIYKVAQCLLCFRWI